MASKRSNPLSDAQKCPSCGKKLRVVGKQPFGYDRACVNPKCLGSALNENARERAALTAEVVKTTDFLKRSTEELKALQSIIDELRAFDRSRNTQEQNDRLDERIAYYEKKLHTDHKVRNW